MSLARADVDLSQSCNYRVVRKKKKKVELEEHHKSCSIFVYLFAFRGSKMTGRHIKCRLQPIYTACELRIVFYL